jgi:hypothetical protein
MTKRHRRTNKEISQDVAEDILAGFYYADFNHVGNIAKMTKDEYVAAVVAHFKKEEQRYDIEDRFNLSNLGDSDDFWNL